MGLSQLLAASRTVRNIKNQPSRFKMTQQNLLPKFGAAKAADEAGDAVEAVAEPVAVLPVVKAPVVTEDMATPVAEPGPTKAAVFAEAAKKLRPFGNWSLFRNPFRRAEARQTVTAPAQAELLLDLVKPVRNDLSEVEFELSGVPRPAVSMAEIRPDPMAAPAPKTNASSGGVWQRLKTRLFGANDKN